MRVAAIVIAFLVVAGPAAAAPPWSSPQRLSSSQLAASEPAIAFGTDGTALATWRADDLDPRTEDLAWQATRPSDPASAFGPEVVGSAGPPPPVRYGASRVVSLEIARTERFVRASFGRAGGPSGAARTIGTGRRIARASLAANARGDVAAAWLDDRGTSNDHVMLALRRPGRGFGTPLRLATGRIRDVALAVGPRGDVLVVWDARGVVRARLRRAGAARFSPTETIASRPAFFAKLAPAVSATGRAAVAWSAQLLTEGGDRGPGFVQAAVRPAGGRAFRAAELLERVDASVEVGRVSIAVERSGAQTVAWTGREGAASRIKVATTDAAARFGPPQPLGDPPPGSLAPSVAVAAGPRGDAAVVWGGAPDAEAPLRGAYRAPGAAAFGPTEPIGDPAERAYEPALAFDPRSGLPTAVWTTGAFTATATRF